MKDDDDHQQHLQGLSFLACSVLKYKLFLRIIDKFVLLEQGFLPPERLPTMANESSL
jgi:hypothetical protein